MLSTIIADVQALIADIQAKNWLAVAKDFAKLIADVASGTGSVQPTDSNLNNLKAALHDAHVEATNAGVGSPHPILASLLQAIIAALPSIIAILTKPPVA